MIPTAAKPKYNDNLYIIEFQYYLYFVFVFIYTFISFHFIIIYRYMLVATMLLSFYILSLAEIKSLSFCNKMQLLASNNEQRWKKHETVYWIGKERVFVMARYHFYIYKLFTNTDKYCIPFSQNYLIQKILFLLLWTITLPINKRTPCEMSSFIKYIVII